MRNGCAEDLGVCRDVKDVCNDNPEVLQNAIDTHTVAMEVAAAVTKRLSWS